ncbi:hypothetical protein [Rhodanobacter sp. FW106-PBR-LB-2-11]|uniref:hypothetical protein n=1 Tax=Rhodanobacter sp. FW106-PBR-LB-2-11 TaxID=1524463 RepID=UPI0034E47808
MTMNKAGYCVTNYTMGCRDIDSGKVGCFLFDKDRYRRYGDFRATSDVFPDVTRLLEWSRSNGDLCKSETVDRIKPIKASEVLHDVERRTGVEYPEGRWYTEPEAFWVLLVHEFTPRFYPNARFRMDGGMLVIEPTSSRNPWYFDENASENLVLDGDLLIAHDQQGFPMEFLRCSASDVPAVAA